MKRVVVLFNFVLWSALNLSAVTFFPGQTSVVWGINNEQKLVFATSDTLDKEDAGQVWNSVKDSTMLQAVAVGKNLQLWAVNTNGEILCRRDVSAQHFKGSEWVVIKGPQVKTIAVGPEGHAWALLKDGRPIVREGVTDNNPQGTRWSLIEGKALKKIAVGANYRVWAIDSQGKVFFRTKTTHKNVTGSGWNSVNTPTQMLDIAVAGKGLVWALDRRNKVWFREGITPLSPRGISWKKISGIELVSLSAGPDFQVMGLDDDGNVYKRLGITPTYLKGAAWSSVPGKLKSLACGSISSVEAGGQQYVHVGPKRKDDDVVYHYAWRFKDPGNGWLKFRARSQADLKIGLSTKPMSLPNNTYELTIGGQDLSTGSYSPSKIVKLGTDQREVVHPLQKNRFNSFLTKGNAKHELKWDDYWVRLENGVVSWGKSSVVGNNEVMRFEDEQAMRNIKYVGLGGLKKYLHEFSNIQMSGSMKLFSHFNLSNGFSRIAGKARRVSVGSRNNKLLALAVGADYNLYRYESNVLAELPWVKINAKNTADKFIAGFKDVSVASDGTVCALDLTGKAYQYDWDIDRWDFLASGQYVQHTFDRITVGNKHCIWALNKSTRNCYQLVKNEWIEQVTGGCLSLQAGLDGTVVAINTALEAYQFNYRSFNWRDLVNTAKLGRISVGARDMMWGTHAVDNVYQIWSKRKNTWHPVISKNGSMSAGFKQVSVNAAGTVFALDDHGNIYKNANNAVSSTFAEKIVKNYLSKVGGSQAKA